MNNPNWAPSLWGRKGVFCTCINAVSQENVVFFQASFKTPWFAAGEGCNMTFFYHMNDRSNKKEMGSLAVEVKTVDQTWFMVFRKAGDQGDIWHQGTIDLSVRHLSLHHYNIFF